MPNRKRSHQICLRFTDDEFSIFEKKCTESGLSQTDFIVSALKKSTVKIYRIDEDIKPVLKELRHISSNINQLAYFSNIGQDYKIKQEIEQIRIQHNRIMTEISEILKNPKCITKCSET